MSDFADKMKGKGPFTIIDGKPSDAGIWEADMDDESEKKFDDYMFVARLNRLVNEELAARQANLVESIAQELDMLEESGEI